MSFLSLHTNKNDDTNTILITTDEIETLTMKQMIFESEKKKKHFI